MGRMGTWGDGWKELKINYDMLAVLTHYFY
jgi:hypothetical protein